MKNVFIILFLSLTSVTIAQTRYIRGQNSMPVKGDYFQGYIFDKYYELIPNEDFDFKFTASKEDIAKAEQIVFDSLILTNKLSKYPPRNYINQNFTQYQRQYQGLINQQGDSIIYINYLLHSKHDLSLQIIDVLDGGTDYWHVYVNLSKGIIEQYDVNGEG